MFRPNFCSQCGKKIIRLHWRLWTSRRFCDSCARQLRKERIKTRALAAVTLIGLGIIIGRSVRPAPPPLIIQRVERATVVEQNTKAAETQTTLQANVYMCGARTKKGTPCSRRVHGPVRCWQHKGQPAMLSPDKLIVKD
jgi:hypothetical protein